eukprot:jgi/Botrbrau1/19646/Bobra.0003s0015.1
MHSAMTVTLRIAPSCTLATGRSRAAGVASATAEGPKVKSAPLSRRVVGLTGILSGASVLSSGFRDAKAEEDTLGETIEKLEEIEPLVAEELKAIEASGGAGEVKEVVADILEVEAKLEALEKEVDTLGGEADPLGLTAAAAPLKQRLKELGDLIALFAPK